MELSAESLSQFNENIQSRRILASSKAEAHRQQLKFGDDLRQQYADLLPTFKNDPFYAALSFYGQFQITNKAAINTAKKRATTSADFITALQTTKPLKISKDAKPIWDRLLLDYPEGAAYAVLLNMSLDTLEYPPVTQLTDEEKASGSFDQDNENGTDYQDEANEDEDAEDDDDTEKNHE
jgi:hypothetical protein